MMSTQRLVMIILGINLIIGVAHAIYENPALYNNERLTTDQNYYSQFGQQIKSDDPYSGVTNRDYQQELSIGNSISWGGILWSVFTGGLNPFSITAGDFQTLPEKIIADALTIFRSLMYVLIIIEVIMIFKNKKNS